MPSAQVLEPVLKMKVDELFLNWLSDPTTQSLLKDYLDLIKSGQNIDLSGGDALDKRSFSFSENNNVTSHKNLAEKKPAALSTPSSPPSASTLPSGSSSNTRVTGPRVLRRSVSTKKVNNLLKQ
ncbi:serine/threonine-protein phosphatase 2A regulatory subunit B'' subunit beta-like protein [Lates japonicus]|uniref:Serine/threonine-protein phosphatase 2A regulatory subunit B'' subunit beta-like protein n=1 Tax=Lates japonicus TaxID=270547 RepID=A0AAD3NIP7_LATJO|nr:serine/threonine-protein phosphatase 2A regulatory subunit B'' subunit beta-like protein [Lates japonicus]GLD73180.1 serine/threonine-protein phosphatase 2A regulatory subunit B'' subunit beta-like protein [Lates japonicus]